MTTQTLNIELDYDQDATRSSNATGRPGGYIGSGTGQARGDIEGAVKWDLYEDQAPDKCDASFVGTITSVSGDRFDFETRGVLFAPTDDEPGIYHTNSEVNIESISSDAGKFSGEWVGTFDATSYHHSYVVTLGTPD